MPVDFTGKNILITGGTRGIGLATGLAFGRLGAQCVLTHKWGSADENTVRRMFADAGAPTPSIVRADVTQDEDTRRLVEQLRQRCERVEVFVSNVAFGQVVRGPADYTRRALFTTIDYTAWPLVSYTEIIRAVFGAPPRYVVGLSSTGPDGYIPNYDMIACSKALLETVARYLAHHYSKEDCRVNVIRAGMVDTKSLVATLGNDKITALRGVPGAFMPADDVAKAIVGLCSGLLDAVIGQVIQVDAGRSFAAEGVPQKGGE